MVFQKGHKHSKKIKNKIGIALKRKPKTEEHKKKISKALEGKKSHFWKGGISIHFQKKIAPRPKPEQCEICGIFGKELKHGLCYDHNHQTGKFRGWICQRCNTAIGMVNDNKEILFRMIEYLN